RLACAIASDEQRHRAGGDMELVDLEQLALSDPPAQTIDLPS
ncbi:hypothetical protein PA598K_07170, partial [Paenibacillus sp. 598K]